MTEIAKYFHPITEDKYLIIIEEDKIYIQNKVKTEITSVYTLFVYLLQDYLLHNYPGFLPFSNSLSDDPLNDVKIIPGFRISPAHIHAIRLALQVMNKNEDPNIYKNIIPSSVYGYFFFVYSALQRIDYQYPLFEIYKRHHFKYLIRDTAYHLHHYLNRN